MPVNRSIAPVTPQAVPVTTPRTAKRKSISIRITLRPPRALVGAFRRSRTYIAGLTGWKLLAFRGAIFGLVAVLAIGIITPLFNSHWQDTAYALSAGDKAVVQTTDDTLAKSLVHDAVKQTYSFNANYSPLGASSDAVSAGGPVIKGELHDDLSQGVTITDPTSSANLTITPQENALTGHQTKNQIEYPILAGAGSYIYTADAQGIKEDILLRHEMGDTMKFQYKLGLDDQYAAKIQDDGSLAIYDSSFLSQTNISTGSSKDAALLAKARQNAKKDNLVFVLPSPIINSSGQRNGSAKAAFSLKGDILTVTATNLKSAAYPLSIDPTVQISTASEDVRNTSIESNADFDVTNNKITRGALTGGTTGTWTATTTLNQARFLEGAVAYNGIMYVIGGSNTTSTANLAGNNANMVEYSTIGTGSPATLGAWTAGNHSGLPLGGLSRFQLLAYHGFLYAIGGSTTDTTCTTVSSTVYYAPVQVNGVLGNWSTTNAPATARCSFGATVYGGKIYIAGGKTGAAASTGSTDVSYANVNPDGTLTWTSGVTPALPAARYGADLQAYNGYLYMTGGNLNGTLTNTVIYAALNTNGSIYTGSWSTTNIFSTPRENLGAAATVIKNGYIYLSGGCSALNASQTCTTVQGDTQLAQINADGSLGQWATTTSLTGVRVGAAEVVWRSTVYNLGGCAAMNAAAIYCTTTLGTTQYGTIAAAGQASVLKSSSIVTSPVSAYAYPLGVFGASAAVLNGFLYVVGGCITNSCDANPTTAGQSDTTNQTYDAQINADGTLGPWANNAANVINGASTGHGFGVAEMGLVAANGSLYGFGGYNYSGALRNAWVMTPDPNTGATNAWSLATTYTNVLTAALYAESVLYVNGTFIVIGGCNAGANAFGCNPYLPAVNKYTFTGGTWSGATALTSIPTGANYSNAAFGLAYYNNYIYLCGGTDAGAAYTQYCTFAKLDPVALTIPASGVTGTWALTTGKINVGTSPDHPIRRSQAYASNGYLYVFAGHDGLNGVPVGTINIGKINPSTGQIDSDFTISTTAFTAKWDTTSAFADGNIYTVGGCTTGSPPTGCSVRTTLTEYFQIYNATNSGDRSIVAGTTYPTSGTGSCTSNCTGIEATATGGYIYAAGGCLTYTVSTAACTATTGNTYFAALNPDGSMGAWTAGPTLPATKAFGCMVALNGTLYYIGGDTAGTAGANVYYSTATGSSWGSGSWASATSLGAVKDAPSCGTWNNRVYVTGGSDSAAVYYSSSVPSGGNISTWTLNGTSFATNRSYHSTVAIGGYLYVIGGYDATNTAYLSDVQYALIASVGSVGSWVYGNDLPYKQRQSAAFGANGYIYVLGGANGTSSTSCNNNQDVASVNSDGTLSAWTQGVATSFTAVAGLTVGYYNGYYYEIGGNNCTANVSSVNYAGEQSQAIRSIFTRYIDFVGDATPENFVVNGNNAAVNGVDIEKWRLTYSSSRVTTNAFGVQQVVTPLSFGSFPTAYTALDASSINQGLARYWLMTFDIDQTNSFTFADANTTQPAITSYSFYYAPNPATRLRNGRVFQDQTKQSLDAHP